MLRHSRTGLSSSVKMNWKNVPT